MITDDVFEHHPIDAIWILKKSEFTTKDRKLVTRPGFRSWASKLLNKYHHELEGSAKAVFDRRVEIVTFISNELVHDDQWAASDSDQEELNPVEWAKLVSPDSSSMPWYKKTWEDNPRVATDSLVEWFAGWACTQAAELRRFIVVSSASNAEWAKKYQHLEILTVEDFQVRHR